MVSLLLLCVLCQTEDCKTIGLELSQTLSVVMEPALSGPGTQGECKNVDSHMIG